MRWLLWLVLSVASSQACAAWIRIGRTEDSNVYADPSSIKRSGRFVTLSTLTDYTAPQLFQGNAYHSYQAQWEYDCTNPKREILVSVTHYRGNMGKGGTVAPAQFLEEWDPVIPKRLAEGQWRFACTTK